MEKQVVRSPYGKLNSVEEAVIHGKQTERPFSGRYDRHFRRGVYVCRNCGRPLYVSDDKFDSGCGWPSFEDSLPLAVTRTREPDGRHTISCAVCGAHLGHVFTGERMTSRNTRHCVNSASLFFEPQESLKLRRAVFAGGCFWGVADAMRKCRGVILAVAGYTGGRLVAPTHCEVCTGNTGHAEAVAVFFCPKKTDYEQLCRRFFAIHDPTQEGRQGPDLGNQYRSEIFYLDEEQKDVAERILDELRANGIQPVTRLTPYARFYNADSKDRSCR